jgi:hypothetical protein
MVPNWIQPFDIMRPLQSGAGLGLQVRNANLAEAAEERQAQRAADALRLNYAQLAAEVQGREVAQQQAAQQQAALQLHRSALERHQQAQEQQAMRAADSLDKYRNDQTDLRKSQAATTPTPVELRTPDGKHLAWGVPGARGSVHVLPEPGRANQSVNFADRTDVSDATAKAKKLIEALPAEVPKEKTFWGKPNPEFQSYKTATNDIAQLEAKKAAVLDKYRAPAAAATATATQPTEADLIKQANEAISLGADPAKVKERLKKMGIAFKE